ncbi:efflux RND transporter periplasmic adaptor subunit [Bacillus pseudomycoides]|uniref:efflux RND transporter periplasmic adaptor subunit n=1 Tax=Bacillus pseudomycoides TaxID=64104 RepID=UPI000BEC2858|nr:HlyD family efflux transporter periplasmic adaptor subunit [Bacillus pseudomycoides]PDY48647.1 RND transporter [Bacillus pseudomycoides]PEA84406.1 RND transporter [Bacillus pseudomycoides]PED74005.1 RND transporter [Bacillus pseudomycoides]PEI42883.1 RND transporter [Bacillus pseudomycoides]PEJ80402.1 RND transporter [Bacillus pseudomycoides]
MEYRTEQDVTRKKRNIKIISGLFIGLLIILTLFSNTLANWNLPKVTTDKPRNDQLKQTFTGNGELQPQEEAKLSTSSVEAKVKEVHVKEGDHVKKNQLLVTYDSKKSEQVILDEEATLQIQKLALNDAQANYNEAKKNQQENKSNDQPNNQQENKSNSQPNGGISETSVQSLKTVVESKKIEISTQERKIKSLKEELEMSKKLIAPFDGVITKINAQKDQLSTRDEGDVILSDESKGFKAELQVPADLAMHLKIGEKIDLKGNAKSLEGELVEIQNIESNENERPKEQGEQQGEQTPANPQPQKRILVKVQGEELKKGDQVEATLTKQLTKGVLIPTSVIQRGTKVPFVYTIEEKKGPLGNAFYITESPITLGESNGQETLVLQGVHEKDQIVLKSSEPLKKGERVKVK